MQDIMKIIFTCMLKLNFGDLIRKKLWRCNIAIYVIIELGEYSAKHNNLYHINLFGENNSNDIIITNQM